MAKVSVKPEYCKSCRLCLNVCPRGILHVGTHTNQMGYDAAEPDEEKECIGCGFCATVCPEGAIEVYK